jgi:hypothetical protein
VCLGGGYFLFFLYEQILQFATYQLGAPKFSLILTLTTHGSHRFRVHKTTPTSDTSLKSWATWTYPSWMPGEQSKSAGIVLLGRCRQKGLGRKASQQEDGGGGVSLKATGTQAGGT